MKKKRTRIAKLKISRPNRFIESVEYDEECSPQFKKWINQHVVARKIKRCHLDRFLARHTNIRSIATSAI